MSLSEVPQDVLLEVVKHFDVADLRFLSVCQRTRELQLQRSLWLEVETPEHALITCESSDALVELRAKFFRELFTALPTLRNQMVALSNTEFLKAIIYPRPTIALVAKFVFDVLEVFLCCSRVPFSNLTGRLIC
ncbi:hypothetical protein C8F04DRAFT_1132932 [Mycena alexandri]|uniref:F-box domain-containing protein n=1 Tax=Mycena alexandri TaxID=1745969 RepID=A0AAD6SAX3_9AGAR|nr:hypothetical protein C8F04DRAFT_1132932 [Mycena alexandri]